ncbi:MAG: ATP-binding cassette domain-containing protein [Phycisphaerales bacterium]|nr:ATP-binding cassette domain-containing protein [Phycisphaerales bacterium]
MPAPRLQVRALKKSFGTNMVLRDLAFELAPGEIHALIGGNGAGKSTLSKIVAGIAPCDAGEMALDGALFAPASRRAAQAAGVVMESLNAQRDAVSGVSIDEESINLISFQRQYQGSAKVISVADELTQTLLSLI